MKVDRSTLRLRTHQQENLNFFRAHARGLSLLPFGSGKTAPAILRIGDLVANNYKALIVTTTGTIFKWMRELKVWGHPDWKAVALIGKREARLRLFAEPHNVAITNYEGLQVLIQALGARFAKKYGVKVFDEIHRVRSHDIQISQAAAYISHPNFADYVYGLTGRPVLESVLDCYAIMRVIDPTVFSEDYDSWRERYFDKVSDEKDDGTKTFPKWQPKVGAADFIAKRLHALSFRKERGEVQVEYPRQIFAPPLVVDLKGRSRRLYDSAEGKLQLALRHQVMSLVHIYPRLEKLCQLARGWCYDASKAPILLDHRPALDAFSDYMEDVRGQGKVVIWAVRAPDMAMVAGVLRKMNIRPRIIHGGIRALKKREEISTLFNDGYIDALIAHPRCIGEGVDLHANFSFRYSYRWSANEWDQPIGRFARMSSIVDWVHYQDVVVRDTIDEGIVSSVSQKLDVGEMVLKAAKLPWRRLPGEEVVRGLAIAG